MTTALADPPGSYRYPYDPTGNERQLALHHCQAQEILYGGAAGGGKSDALIAAGVTVCMLIPNAKVILFRRTFKMLEQEIIPRMLERIPGHVAHYSSDKHVFTFRHNGATFRLGYLDAPRDLENYTGPEYVMVLWDELTQFQRNQYVFMRSRCRMAGPIARDMQARGWVPRMIATTNPGGVGHGWVKRMFVDPAIGLAIDEVFWGGVDPGDSEDGKRWMAYIPAKASDNPHLDLPAYRQQLAGLDPVLRKALEDGDWNILQGVRFPQFREGIHVVRPEQIMLPMIGYPRAMGVDYGQQAPFAALWGCLVGETVIVYRELYKSNLTAKEQAAWIAESEQPGERAVGRPIPIALDPSCWARASEHTATSPDKAIPPVGSIAYYYWQRFGNALKPAHNDRVQGWHLIDHYLGVQETGLARLIITRACPNLIRTLPELQRSNTNPEDVLRYPKQEDHCPDALRYLLFQLVGGGHIRAGSGAGGFYAGEQDMPDKAELALDHVPTDRARPSRYNGSRRRAGTPVGLGTGVGLTDN